jgi:hypothetical protein
MRFAGKAGPALARAVAITAAMLFLGAGTAAADTPDAPGAPAAVTAEASPAASDAAPREVLATESAARLGVARLTSERKLNESTQMVEDPAMRWLLIIGISALAIWLIVTLAD